MTSKAKTGLRTLPVVGGPDNPASWRQLPQRAFYYAITWPFLLKSLSGGSPADRKRLIERLALPAESLPNLGGWKADSLFLNRIIDWVEALQPKSVVELGAGASTLVTARALSRNGGGSLISFDQHAPFVEATRQWLAENGIESDLRHAPLVRTSSTWPGPWYDLHDLPDQIDLLIVDGPPWSLHPYVRGQAEVLFDRIPVGGAILLDDAFRPGERIIASRWKKAWPNFDFTLLPGGAKGTLQGVRRR
ncbi:class I SAM-dependent methyltransferase [Sphingomonas jaspsi]|uniref:class I SAM-dependent methyltransferase n=1 Tax=Sphingomonas jaspsi TaxID=392409 RepID=UPI0004AC7292|nr:class I SAM-dependent methyltransferase [Sphingomonas jaspsi]